MHTFIPQPEGENIQLSHSQERYIPIVLTLLHVFNRYSFMKPRPLLGFCFIASLHIAAGSAGQSEKHLSPRDRMIIRIPILPMTLSTRRKNDFSVVRTGIEKIFLQNRTRDLKLGAMVLRGLELIQINSWSIDSCFV